jgi:hypothetical protein
MEKDQEQSLLLLYVFSGGGLGQVLIFNGGSFFVFCVRDQGPMNAASETLHRLQEGRRQEPLVAQRSSEHPSFHLGFHQLQEAASKDYK